MQMMSLMLLHMIAIITHWPHQPGTPVALRVAWLCCASWTSAISGRENVTYHYWNIGMSTHITSRKELKLMAMLARGRHKCTQRSLCYLTCCGMCAQCYNLHVWFSHNCVLTCLFTAHCYRSAKTISLLISIHRIFFTFWQRVVAVANRQ